MSDYNIGGIMANCYNDYFNHQNVKIHGAIDKLATNNMEIKILSDLINRLAHAKQEGKKVDFNSDPKVREYIVHIHKNNPTIFGDLVEGFPEYLLNNEKVVSASSTEDLLEKSLKNIDINTITIHQISESQIEVILAGLDSELKAYNADLNTNMLHINRDYDEISTMTEQAQRVLQNDRELKDHITRKTGA